MGQYENELWSFSVAEPPYSPGRQTNLRVSGRMGSRSNLCVIVLPEYRFGLLFAPDWGILTWPGGLP